MTRDDWFGLLQDDLETAMNRAPDETCRLFAEKLLQETYEFTDGDDPSRSSCDVCGATDRPTATVIAYGIETNACDKCRGVEEER